MSGFFDYAVYPFPIIVDPEPPCARRFTFDFNQLLRIQHSQNPFGTHLMQALDKFLFTNIWVYIKPVITYNRLLPWMHFYMSHHPDKKVKISYIPKRCIRKVNPIEKCLLIKAMDTLTIQLKNRKAYKLLKEMEELNLIKIIKTPSSEKLSSLRGKIKAPMNDRQIDKQLKSLNKEWERISPDEILRQARMMRKEVKGSLSSEEIQDAIDQGRS